jgi:8-oxo-dGTP pyrophosphatase MutT (NUDIX family)
MVKEISDEEYYGNLPKKHIGAVVLLFNEAHQLLLIKPTYKEGWSIPGGGVEQDETPKTTAVREVKEEVGLDLKDVVLICVAYTPRSEIKPETLQFIFYSEDLNVTQIDKIRLGKKEHSEYKFVDIQEATVLLNERQKHLLPFCIEAVKNNKAVYVEL